MAKKETTSDTKVVSTAARIRALLTEGKSVSEIAALLGVTRQRVYVVRSVMKRKLAAAKPKAKRQYVRSGKYAKKTAPTSSGLVDEGTMLELDRNRLKDEVSDLKELNAQFIKDIQDAVKPKVIYREITVPQPFSHYSFWQRLRILFLGGTA